MAENRMLTEKMIGRMIFLPVCFFETVCITVWRLFFRDVNDFSVFQLIGDAYFLSFFPAL